MKTFLFSSSLTHFSYSQNLTVENENGGGSGMSSDAEGEESLLLNSNSTTPLVTPMASPSQQHSPLLRKSNSESLSLKSSPRLIRQNPVNAPSPHGSPKITKVAPMSPVSFFMGADGSVTFTKIHVLMKNVTSFCCFSKRIVQRQLKWSRWLRWRI